MEWLSPVPVARGSERPVDLDVQSECVMIGGGSRGYLGSLDYPLGAVNEFFWRSPVVELG